LANAENAWREPSELKSEDHIKGGIFGWTDAGDWIYKILRTHIFREGESVQREGETRPSEGAGGK